MVCLTLCCHSGHSGVCLSVCHRVDTGLMNDTLNWCEDKYFKVDTIFFNTCCNTMMSFSLIPVYCSGDSKVSQPKILFTSSVDSRGSVSTVWAAELSHWTKSESSLKSPSLGFSDPLVLSMKMTKSRWQRPHQVLYARYFQAIITMWVHEGSEFCFVFLLKHFKEWIYITNYSEPAQWT